MAPDWPADALDVGVPQRHRYSASTVGPEYFAALLTEPSSGVDRIAVGHSTVLGGGACAVDSPRDILIQCIADGLAATAKSSTAGSTRRTAPRFCVFMCLLPEMMCTPQQPNGYCPSDERKNFGLEPASGCPPRTVRERMPERRAGQDA